MFDWLPAALLLVLLTAAIAWPVSALAAVVVAVSLLVSVVRRRRAGRPAAWRAPAWWGRAAVAAFLVAAVGVGLFVRADGSFFDLDGDTQPRCPVGADCVPSTIAELAAERAVVATYALATAGGATLAGVACLGVAVALRLGGRRRPA